LSFAITSIDPTKRINDMNLEDALTIHQDAELLFDQSLAKIAIADLTSAVENQCKDDFPLVLEEIKSYCIKQCAKSITSVFLMRKTHDRKKAKIHPDYVGFECGDRYTYGVGMDLNSDFRNQPSIYFVDEKPLLQKGQP
jgi:hypothetical protein